jgi:hypothetical protein
MFHAAGGESPLDVFAFGSGALLLVPEGVVLELSDGVVDVVLVTDPLVPPPLVPPLVPVPLTPCVFGSLLELPLSPPADDVVVVNVGVTPPPADALTAFGSTVFALPVLPASCCWVAPATLESSVPVSLLPTIAVTCCSERLADAPAAMLLELVLSVENQRYPPDDVSAVAGACASGVPVEPPAGVAGVESVAAGVDGAAGAVGAAAGVWVGVAVNATVPMLSATTGAFANGSVGVVFCVVFARGAWAWTSDTTGTRWEAVRDGDWGAVGLVAVAAWCVRGASGVWAYNFGVRSSGNAIAGTVMAGSGVVRAGSAGWRKIAPMGAAYIATSTVRPRPAHQYRTPRKRSAINPNG